MAKVSKILGETTRENLDGSAEQVIATSQLAAVLDGKSFYTTAVDDALADQANFEVLIRTTAAETHFQPSASMTGEGLASLFRDPTSSDDGTPVGVFARNQANLQVSGTLAFSAPTITGDGTPLGTFQVIGGSGKSAPGGAANFPLEWVLPPGDYLLRLFNDSGAPVVADIVGSWYERG